MIEERVNFNSGNRRLEGVLTYEERLIDPPLALLCPPHPNLGGDMDNNVIISLAEELGRGGYVALRFNYRGVGGSEGPFRTVAERFRYWESTFGEGNLEGPLEDTRSALAFLKAQVTPSRVFIVGYSFGAIMGIRTGVDDDAVLALAGVATPCGAYNLDCLAHCRKPKLFICSGGDFATSVEETRRAFERFAEPKSLIVKTEVGHFYIGSEKELAREVLTFFKEVPEGVLKGAHPNPNDK
jgi:alpha/beta superfamily hydrolase